MAEARALAAAQAKLIREKYIASLSGDVAAGEKSGVVVIRGDGSGASGSLWAPSPAGSGSGSEKKNREAGPLRSYQLQLVRAGRSALLAAGVAVPLDFAFKQ